MYIPESPSEQAIPVDRVSQIRALLQEMAQDLDAIVLTEDCLPTGTATSALSLVDGGIEQFIVVVSESFSALLCCRARSQARSTAEQALDAELPALTKLNEASTCCYMALSFDSAAILDFLGQLSGLLPSESATMPIIAQAQTAVRPNDPKKQSQFTLRLVTLLSHPLPSCPIHEPLGPVETQLRQQIQQERLLNQVTTQIRQSLELPTILQTAVDQVRQVLNVDRLVIYRLDAEASATISAEAVMNSQVETSQVETSQSADRVGSVIYEALASSSIPSVLNFSEAHCFVHSASHQWLSEKKLAIAVDDVKARYLASPCLLDFLQQAQIRAKLVSPILVRNQLWGLLIAHQCQRPRQWQENEQRFLQQIAEHLAIAICQAQLYAELQQQTHTLEQRVSKRTQELHDVMQAAQAANRAKSEFLAAVSHELRTPLTCIIGMSATLQRWTQDSLSERQINFLQTIHDSGEYLLALINDILDLSQVEAGKMLLTLSEFSLSHLSQQTLKAFEGQASLSDVALEVDLSIPTALDRFVADPRRVQQILFNLLDNAIKFTPTGGKVILRVVAEENLAVLQVQDQGIGIPEQQIPLLFQKFHQLNAGYERQYRGTGLGLALTKQLVELHGGWIDVESTVGLGSVFTVRLPMQPLPSRVAVKTRSTAAYATQGRIVLIEPNEDNADVVCDVLTAAGYQIVWMLEGATAINQIEVLQPIAVITNVHLPDIDGRHLVQRLRQNPMTQHLKIVALVPTSTEAELESWQAMEADAYLVQPLHPNHLLQTVMTLAKL
jgi:two-component system, sensor histidine kinase and response regulator